MAFPVAKSPTVWLYRKRRGHGTHLRRRRGSVMAGKRCSTERKKARGGGSWRGRSGGRNGSAVGRPASHRHGEGEGRLGRREGVGKREIDGELLTGMGAVSRRRKVAARFGLGRGTEGRNGEGALLYREGEVG